MLKLVTTGQFCRDYQRMRKKGCDMRLLEETAERLRSGQPLGKHCRDRGLSGKYAGFRRCRVLPGWTLIYARDREQVVLTALQRTLPLPDLRMDAEFQWEDGIMGALKRAYLYLTRKRARTILMSAVLLVMGLFLLTGLSIRSGAKQAAEEVRRTINTGIVMELLPMEGSRVYDLSVNEEGETVRTVKLPILAESQIHQLLEIEGVEGYFTEMGYRIVYTGLNVHPGGYARSLAMMEEEDPEGAYFNIEEEQARQESALHSNGVYLVEDGRWHPFFTNGALELKEGRHIELGDVGKAVISEELAQRNGLRIGDTIESRNYDFITGERYGSTFESEIVGIFQINFEQDLSNWTAEDAVLANVIFADPAINYWGQVEYNTFYGRSVLAREADRAITNLTLFVEDPMMLESVQEELLAMDLADWSYYTFKRYDHDYKIAAKPLLTISSLSTILVVMICAGALAVLSLILTMWIRSRKREIGILTSIGTKKKEILLQFILECCLAAVTAFILAGILAGPLTSAVGKGLEGNINASAGDSEYEAVVDAELNLSVNKLPSGNITLEYELMPETAAFVFLAMLLVSIASVALSSRQIFRQKPSEVLRGG